MASTKPTGFGLGDHTFYHPSQNAPIERFEAPKRQILGAPPPSFLEGIAREATKSSKAAKALYKGEHCGHSEPTMTIFDLVMGKQDLLELVMVADPEADEDAPPMLVMVGKEYNDETDFHVIWDQSWLDKSGSLINLKPRIVRGFDDLPEGEVQGATARLAVGFEYPADADSRDAVSWYTIDFLEPNDKSPACVLSCEMS